MLFLYRDEVYDSLEARVDGEWRWVDATPERYAQGNVDYLRNTRGATAVASYSPRASR